MDAPEIWPDRRAGSSAPARSLGLLVLGLASMGALVQLRAATVRRSGVRTVTRPGAADATRHLESNASPLPAVTGLHGAAALLATSVLADSGIEHYRARFENPGMFASLVAAGMTLAAGLTGLRQARAGRSRNSDRHSDRNSDRDHDAAAPLAALPHRRQAGTGWRIAGRGPDVAYAGAAAVGLAGTGFHVYNLLRRPGGWRWSALFYGAPLGAPAALSMAGLLGLAGRRLQAASGAAHGRLLGLPAGRALAGLTGVGLAGTVAEAGLLHFRGAFQNPLMWLPVSLPPLAAGGMITVALQPALARGRPGRLLRIGLGTTALLGMAGAGLHCYGVARQMGGWRNWQQNLLSGPPIPAPPAFSALALAARAALALLEPPPAAGRRPG